MLADIIQMTLYLQNKCLIYYLFLLDFHLLSLSLSNSGMDKISGPVPAERKANT
jgi:hypothetical protein